MSRNSKKLGNSAYELVKEFDSSLQIIPSYDNNAVHQVLQEIRAIFEENSALADTYSASGDRAVWPLLNFRHAALQRNKRCLMVYIYQRLQRIKTLRWEFGVLLPKDIRAALCAPEIQFFEKYSKMLSTYMQNIGGGQGLDLVVDLGPPKSLYIEVLCVQDYGRLDLDDGEVIFLKKNSRHNLPRSQAELLIRQVMSDKFALYTDDELHLKLTKYLQQLNYELDEEMDELDFSAAKRERQQDMIRLLHDYNEIKDAAQIVIGALANQQDLTIKDLHLRYNLPADE